jgi:hypothetical protein
MSLVRTVALLARLQPLLMTIHEEKSWYLSVLEKNQVSEKNDFLLNKTSSHIKELENICCMIDTLLFPECKEENSEDKKILDYLHKNEAILNKLKERMK